MSTRFNRPNGDYDGDVSLTNRDKYQQDSAANPKVAIDSSNIDGDFNFVVDSLNALDDDVTSIVASGVSDGSVTNAKLRDSAAYSVVGRSGSTIGDVADITASTDHGVLRRLGTALGFGKIDTDNIENSAVTNAKIADSTITQAKLNFSVTAAPSALVSPYAGSTAPSGWLLCDGSAVSRNAYAALYAIVSDTYGAGNGTTTFNLPDLRGRSVFGLDNMGGTAASLVTSGISGIDGTTLGATGGDESSQAHTHTATQDPHSHSMPSTFGSFGGGANNIPASLGGSATTTGEETPAITVTSYGDGGSENMPPAMLLNWIIKT
tara:strand:+ start:9431 stop:10393 length:963 start_codon:yes stop_codon:yes gene_type:complete